ncbi:MAG: hypothetical protein Q7N50_15480 [Armatimonadota bacterium]|nr:hypothetical protein [Armatimonadota bacterium]
MHALVALIAFRAADVIAGTRAGILAGAPLGLITGLLVVTLFAIARTPTSSCDNRPRVALSYLGFAHRLPDRADFAGAIVCFILWFAICQSPMFTSFKLAWLGAAILITHALARPISYRSRLH